MSHYRVYKRQVSYIYLSESQKTIPIFSLCVDFLFLPRRWLVMTSVILLNICGYMLSVSFAPVAPEAAEYYEVSGDMIDMFPLVAMGVNIPGVLVGLFCIDKWGIKVTTDC